MVPYFFSKTESRLGFLINGLMTDYLKADDTVPVERDVLIIMC